MDTRAEKIALFRYGLIAPLVLEVLPRGELTRRAEEIAARKYEIPYSERAALSSRGLSRTSSETTLRSRAIACRCATAGGADRTSKTREPTSHRHDSAARTGAGVKHRLSCGLRRHSVSLPQTARLDHSSAA